MKKTLLLLILSISFSGKAFFAAFDIVSTPSDAKIYIDGDYKGTGKAYLAIYEKKDVEVRVEKDGYISYKKIYAYKSEENGKIAYSREDNVLKIILMESPKEVTKTKVTPSVKGKTQTKSKQKEIEVVSILTVEDVYKVDTITFYGYDFSHMKFVEEKKIEDGDRIVELIPKWQHIINEHNSESYFKKILRVDNVVMRTNYGEAQSEKVMAIDVIGDSKAELSTDDIQKWLTKYKLKENKGVGYIIFIDCFYKPRKNVAMTFVFFDIATKRILIADKFDGNEADGYGLPHYWAQGVTATIELYHSDVFRKNKKKYSE